MCSKEIFRKIKEELTEKEQMVLESMLQGDTVVDTAKNCGISIAFAQSYRKTVYEIVGRFVDFGKDKTQKQKVLIEFLRGYNNASNNVAETPVNKKSDRLDCVPYMQISQQEVKSTLTLVQFKKQICSILNISEIFSVEEVIKILENLKHSDEEFTRLVNDNNDLLNQVTHLKNRVFEFTKQCSDTFEAKKSEQPNYCVFNPRHGQPNKVYKTKDEAIEDAKDIAKTTQKPIYVLKIDSLVVPQCSYEINDLSLTGIPCNYFSEEISL